jgi:colicin import membrane protein
MTQATPYHVPKEPGRWRALLLAGAVHIGLLAFLWFGVRWQNETPVAVEAEVWSPQIREAAPPPQPESKPEPKPEIKEAPKPAPVVQPPVVQPDIALEQEKKRKEKEQKQREDELRAEKDRREKERLAKEEAARKLQEEDKKKKELAEKKRKQDEAAAETKLAQAREDNLKRMMAQAGSGGTGAAPQSQGPRGNADYLGKVGARIRSNTIFNVPDNLATNPAVEYAVELLPDGSIRQPIRKIKPSGVPGFDEAVLNAIEKSQPFPADRSGKVPSGFNVVHRPKDQ